MVIYIIEHLEPKVWKWCELEYTRISKIVGKENLWFTNLPRGAKALEPLGKVIKQPVRELGLKKVCVLDPEAKQELTSNDTKIFDYVIFGGILGDDPPRKRTGPEVTSTLQQCEIRHLGPRQMSTDSAVDVAHRILTGSKLSSIKFIDDPEIELGPNESTILPYRYVDDNGKPLMSADLLTYIKRRKGL